MSFRGITADSKKCRPGFLFVATRGATPTSRDGHDFIDDAINNGVTAVVVDHNFIASKDYGIPIIRSHDSKIALCHLAEAFYGYPSSKLKVIGITGTNGKTSTSFMLHSILRKAGYKPQIMGTLGMGDPGSLTPLSHTTMEPEFVSEHLAKMRNEGASHVIMEISSHALSLKRVEAISFSAVALTNITQDHLDFHKTIEDYQRAKARLFFELAHQDTAIVWPKDHPFSKPYDIPNLSFFDDSPDDFYTANANLASALAKTFGIPEQAIADGLAACPIILGRLEEIKNPHGFRVLVDFAHTPDALKKLLCTVKKLKPRRLILVFGCGGERDKDKRPIMGQIAHDLADVVVVTDDNPRKEDPKIIRQEILNGIKDNSKALEIPHRRSAIRHAISHAEKNDIVVIAGKGHENYQIYGDDRLGFSDQAEALKILGAL